MRGYQSNATSSHRAVSRLSAAAGEPADAMRGVSADRKRLRGKYPADFSYTGKQRKPQPTVDDGD